MAFAMGLQSGVGQLDDVVGPRIIRSKYPADGYRVSYAVCVGALGGCFLFVSPSWWLARDLERNLHCVKHARNQATRVDCFELDTQGCSKW